MFIKKFVLFMVLELFLNVLALEIQNKNLYQVIRNIHERHKRHSPYYHWGHQYTDCPYPVHDAQPHYRGPQYMDWPYHQHDTQPHYWEPQNPDWQYPHHDTNSQHWGPKNDFNPKQSTVSTNSQNWGTKNTDFYPQQSTDDDSGRIGGINLVTMKTVISQENQASYTQQSTPSTDDPSDRIGDNNTVTMDDPSKRIKNNNTVTMNTVILQNTQESLRDNMLINFTKLPYNPIDDKDSPSYKQCRFPKEPEKPNFAAPGRRISEVKCYEHVWGIRLREWKQRHIDYCLYVIKGEKTKPGEYPHMAAIGWKATVGTWIFKCGGSLISSKFVLTAGHCVRASSRDESISDTVPKLVRLGDKNISDKPKDYQKPIDVNISRIIRHPLYKSPAKYNDVALFELEKDVVFTRYVSPACLWTNVDVSSAGPKAIVTGWGVIDSKSAETSFELQAAAVDLIDSGTCEKILRPSCNRLWCGVRENQLCAGTLAGGADTCQGDSGGPLQTKIHLPKDVETAVHYVIGVTSFGIKCGRSNSPGVYTRVSSYLDWIESVVWPENHNFNS